MSIKIFMLFSLNMVPVHKFDGWIGNIAQQFANCVMLHKTYKWSLLITTALLNPNSVECSLQLRCFQDWWISHMHLFYVVPLLRLDNLNLDLGNCLALIFFVKLSVLISATAVPCRELSITASWKWNSTVMSLTYIVLTSLTYIAATKFLN